LRYCAASLPLRLFSISRDNMPDSGICIGWMQLQYKYPAEKYLIHQNSKYALSI